MCTLDIKFLLDYNSIEIIFIDPYSRKWLVSPTDAAYFCQEKYYGYDDDTIVVSSHTLIDDLEGILLHEFGHYLYSRMKLKTKNNWENLSKLFPTFAEDYSSTNEEEYFCEAFRWAFEGFFHGEEHLKKKAEIGGVLRSYFFSNFTKQLVPLPVV